MPRNLGAPELVTVTIKPNVKLLTYTKVDSTYYTDFGMTATTWSSSLAVANLVYQSNFPRPYRASKFINATKGYESGYIDPTKIAALRADGWTIIKPKPRKLTLTRKNSYLVYVTINSVKYGWYMNANAAQISDSDLSGLGITKATDADLATIVLGASFPVPPRAKKVVTDGTISTFFDPSKTTLPSGWEAAQPGLESALDLGYVLGLTI